MLTLELLLLLAATIISFYIWGKYKDHSEFKSIILYCAGITMLIWQYFAKNILHLSGQAAYINKYINLVFWIVVGVVFVLFLVKDFKKNKHS